MTDQPLAQSTALNARRWRKLFAGKRVVLASAAAVAALAIASALWLVVGAMTGPRGPHMAAFMPDDLV